MFREELVICWERLWLLRLENQALADKIVKPPSWGDIPVRKKEDLDFLTNLKKHIQGPSISKK